MFYLVKEKDEDKAIENAVVSRLQSQAVSRLQSQTVSRLHSQSVGYLHSQTIRKHEARTSSTDRPGYFRQVANNEDGDHSVRRHRQQGAKESAFC